jgi:hypothetical protein
MNYIKPEIAIVGSASATIHGQMKDVVTGSDSVDSPWHTLGAYEADE